MEIVVSEKGTVHTTTVLRDGDRMAVLVLSGNQLKHAETVGCFDAADAESFVKEAAAWLAARERPANRSGLHAAVRLGRAPLRAAG